MIPTTIITLHVCTFNSQLADTRSTYDKRQTLLHYIAHVVEKLYPHQLSFYDDLDIDEAAKGEGVYVVMMSCLLLFRDANGVPHDEH